MQKQVEKLAQAIQKTQEETPPPEGEVISVDATVSKAASIYEAIRNTLEYDEEHRLRRNAIRRILKRRLGAEESLEEIAQELLHELIWASYLKNNKIHESKIGEVTKVLKKYRPLFGSLKNIKGDPVEMQDWLLDLLSCEIEYMLVPPVEQDALAAFAYQVLKGRIKWQSKIVVEKDRELQLFLSVHRTLLRANRATLRYRVLLLTYPDWLKADEKLIKEIGSNLEKVYQHIDLQVMHPCAESLSRRLRRFSIMFNVLRDVIAKDPAGAIAVIQNDEQFRAAVRKAAKGRYQTFQTRLRRSVIRAVVFLFITKMLLALIIELPYDVVILQTSNFVPLITNVVFFPILLLVIGSTVFIPRKKNTKQIYKTLRSVLFAEGDFSIVYRTKRPWRSTVGKIFDAIYLLMFLVSYGLIAYGLHTVDFNALSIVIFLFFLSLVMFFGIKLRLSKRDFVILKRTGGILATIFDFFFLPIIRAGRWMALRAPRINVFLFFLDYIVEAPFKLAIAMVEGWMAFIREKKEEIE